MRNVGAAKGSYLNPQAGLWRVPPFTWRPDFVQVVGLTLGTVYELKPLSLASALTMTSQILEAAGQLGGYYVILREFAPNQQWSFGRTWLNGITTWPSFPDAPPGHTLVTFDNFAAAPGLIFYNVLGSTDSLEAVAVGAAIGAAAAEAFLAVGGLPGLAASGQAIGQLAYAAGQAAYSVGSAALAGFEGEVGGATLLAAY
jgi:hypothetical protein